MFLWEIGDIEVSKYDINKEMNEVFFFVNGWIRRGIYNGMK